MGDEKSYIREGRLGTLDPALVDRWGDPRKHPETQLTAEQIERLIGAGREAFLSHLTRDGFPIVTVHLYCLLDGDMWTTTVRGRVKEKSYRRDPRCSICLSTTGLKLGFGGGLCIKAHAQVVEDRAVVERVCREHAQRYYGDEKAREAMFGLLFTPNRLAIRLDRLEVISWANVGARSS